MVITKEYLEKYVDWNKIAERCWASNTTENPSLEADIWFNYDAIKIALGMIGNRWNMKQVLAIGAAYWSERELLESLLLRDYVRLDILATEGIDVVADGCQLPFKDNSLDGVLCREVIEHVLDANELLAEIKRVLKPNCFLFITTPNVYNCPPDGKIHVRGYTPRGFQVDLERAGFEVISKRGNVPNIISSLLPLELQGMDFALPDFKEIAKKLEGFEDSYYIGTQMFVLAKKGGE